jgi:acyl carrier protein
MTRDEIRDQVIEITCKYFDVDPGKVTEATSFIDDLADEFNFDAVVKVVMSLEANFGVELSEEALANIKTVGDAIEFIGLERKRYCAAGSP